ncbi:MAG TPA: hypothetical protein VMD05_00755 [Candidatus Nanoarchaeia archaeon]|nr:hypothetical protein [Candidatus Nanoarchaeia archaeon]
MREKKCLIVFLCLLPLYLFALHPANALTTVNARLGLQGSIIYSSPTPSASPTPIPSPTLTPSPAPSSTPNPSSTNLALVPSDWYMTYSSGPQIISLDSSVERTSGKPSIRLDPHTSSDVNVAREVDGMWYNVHPGDHIVATVWMKVQTGSSTANYPSCGARMGIDFYGNINGVSSLLSADSFWNTYYGGDFSKMYVHDANGGAWQQKTIDIIVPATVGAWQYPGQSFAVSSFVVWLQGAPWTVDSTASTVWFADPTLYINP